MGDLSGIVGFDAVIKVFCESHVEMLWILFRSENIYVVEAHYVDLASLPSPNSLNRFYSMEIWRAEP